MAPKQKGREDEDMLTEAVDEMAVSKWRYDVMSYPAPFRPYLNLSNRADWLTTHPAFEGFILACVILACALVGCQTYRSIADHIALVVLEYFVLVVFIVEILLKMLAEGLVPLRFFFNQDWGWNWFDFVIVVLSLPGVPVGNNAYMLRLLRLARLGKVFRQFPEVMVIIMGLIGGLKSIGSIMFLLMFVYYLYAMIGMSLFRANDPFHFDTLRDTFLTLYRCSTMEDWTDVMYINVYGCIDYPGGNDVYVATEAELAANSEKWLCANPSPQPGFAIFYFVSFALSAGFVMLSMFVGAVTLSMAESVEQAREQLLVEAEKKRRKRRAGNDDASKKRKKEKKISIEEQRELNQIKALVLTAWDGETHQPEEVVDPRMENPVLRLYFRVAGVCHVIVNNMAFRLWILILIVLAGILIGLESDNRLTEADKPRVEVVDYMIKTTFTIECILKIVAEAFRPWRYFHGHQDSGWNRFDFVIVAASWWPNGGGVVQTLRLFRLVAILKMAKSLPTLQMNVVALARGIKSIGPIGLLMVLLFYVYSILGVLMFRDNDPLHFETLHTAFLSLFRISTFEDWTDIMYINVMGCDKFGYSHQRRKECTSPQAFGWGGIFYFVTFTILSALIMLNLFIGVITTNMETATAEAKFVARCDAKVKWLLAEDNALTPKTVKVYRRVFALFDASGDGAIDIDEIFSGLNQAGEISMNELQDLVDSVDEEKTGDLNFANFCDLMLKMRERNLQEGGNVKMEKSSKGTRLVV